MSLDDAITDLQDTWDELNDQIPLDDPRTREDVLVEDLERLEDRLSRIVRKIRAQD